MELNKAKALVTGGGSGLGLAVTKTIHHAGGQVAVLDVDASVEQRISAELGESVPFEFADVTSEVSVDKAFNAVTSQFGGITLAVNCAGVMQSKRVIGRKGSLSQEEFTRTIQVNLIGTFVACRAAALKMRDNVPDRNGERGVIINVASIAAYEGQIGQGAYASSKGGIVSLTLPLAREFAHFGIRVMTIAPGLMRTPLLEQLPEAAREHLIQSIPFPHRLGEPDEFAQLVCAIYENPLLNGEVIRLDGALRMPML